VKKTKNEKTNLAFPSPLGQPINTLDTPALLLDLDAVQRNIQRMADFLKARQLQHRPHVKLYRAVPEIAQLQWAAGVIGFTCAKLCEAELLADAGFDHLLIANQLAGKVKIERLARLAARCDLIVAVDNPHNAAELSQAAVETHATLGVLVEVNIGHNRCGVAPFDPALALARQVQALPGLRFRGLMGYDGHCTLKVSETERRALSVQANTLLADTRRHLEAAGVEVEITSGAGTFTYQYAAEVQGITEVQAGTYLMMDSAFRDHGVREFEPALSVLATVSSRPSYPGAERLAVIDTGRKAVSTAQGNPQVKDPPYARVTSLSDEHGRLALEEACPPLHVGDRVELWPSDANGTINQFDRFIAQRDGQVTGIWPITLTGNHT
jgi:D-serine deaminase-like pyridoxal phosphate-dependent protein